MQSISLSEMDDVSLMSRIDTKFYFHQRLLPNILMSIEKDYDILEIKGNRLMPYESQYYDTDNHQMLLWHQNGKLNRFKIRKRTYVLTKESFLEVKFKSNKGITDKLRIRRKGNEEDENSFVEELTPFSLPDLNLVIENSFNRIMLVSKNKKERVSIDLDLSFKNGNEIHKLPKLVLLEIKSERHLGTTELQRSLKFLHIYPSGFSKFITGMYLFNNHLKFNRFKRRFLQLNRTLEREIL